MRVFKVANLIWLLLIAGTAVAVAYPLIRQRRDEIRRDPWLRLLALRRNQPDAKLRRQNADAAADRVEKKYTSLEYLTVEAIHSRFGDRSTVEKPLPLCKWNKQREDFRATHRQTQNKSAVEIRVEGKPVYLFFENETTESDFKYPWNGVPGMFRIVPKSHLRTMLTEGVEASVVCESGIYRSAWIGKKARDAEYAGRVERWVRRLKTGEWIGKFDKVDVVFFDRETIWDFYFVDREGFVTRWITVRFERDDYSEYLTISRNDFTYDTSPVPEEVFSPSQALLEKAKSWVDRSDEPFK